MKIIIRNKIKRKITKIYKIMKDSVNNFVIKCDKQFKLNIKFQET